MHIVIGTKNKAKVTITEKILGEYFPHKNLSVKGEDIPSGVPDTPRGEETKPRCT